MPSRTTCSEGLEPEIVPQQIMSVPLRQGVHQALLKNDDLEKARKEILKILFNCKAYNIKLVMTEEDKKIKGGYRLATIKLGVDRGEVEILVWIFKDVEEIMHQALVTKRSERSAKYQIKKNLRKLGINLEECPLVVCFDKVHQIRTANIYLLSDEFPIIKDGELNLARAEVLALGPT